MKVKGLTSTKTQLPLSYYSLPFCRPGKIEEDAENLGEILLGDRSENSPYVVTFIFILKTFPRVFWFLCVYFIDIVIINHNKVSQKLISEDLFNS